VGKDNQGVRDFYRFKGPLPERCTNDWNGRTTKRRLGSVSTVHLRQVDDICSAALSSLGRDEQAAFVAVALSAMDKAITIALRTLDTQSKPVSDISTDFSGPIKDTAARERRSLETELNLYMSTPTNTPAGVGWAKML
jgi:hypothetical protein